MTPHSKVALPINNFPDLQWFSGIWIGENQGVTIEEHWSGSRGQVHMGMFRMVREEQPVFYEFMTLAIEGDEIILRIKHFNPGLKGWESQDESVIFVLVGLKTEQAVFYQRDIPDNKWMVYHFAGGSLTVHFETAEGEEPGSKLNFLRA